MVWAIDVPTLPPSLRSRANRPTAAPRRCVGSVFEGRHVERGEDHRQAADHHHPRPDHLPRADVQVHQRHPVVAGRHDEQAPGDQPAGVGAPAEQDADDQQHHDRENAGGRLHQSRDIGVVAEQGLQQARQGRAGAVEHGVRTEDDEAGGRQVALAQRPEVDHRVGDPHLPEDQASPAQTRTGRAASAPARRGRPTSPTPAPC